MSDNNLLDFVVIKDTDPRLIINSDSIKMSYVVNYPGFSQYTSNFKMLDGTCLSCRGSDRSQNSVKLYINDDTYSLDRPDTNPLFSFDIRVRFINQSIVDHYFAHCNETTEEDTTTDPTPYTAKQVIATSPSILGVLDDMNLSVTIDITEAEATLIQANIDFIYWKLRMKITKNDYATFAYYRSTLYSDSAPKREFSSLGNYIINNSNFSTAKDWLLTIFTSVGLK